MMRRPIKAALLAVAGLALCAGLALAQTEGQGQERGERPRAEAGPQAFAGGGLGALLGAQDANVTVKELDHGVAVVMTTEPDKVGELQARAVRLVERLTQAAGRAEARPGGERRWPRSLMGLVITGDAKVKAVNTDQGVTLRFTSDDDEVAAALKADAARWASYAGPATGRGGMMRRPGEPGVGPYGPQWPGTPAPGVQRGPFGQMPPQAQQRIAERMRERMAEQMRRRAEGISGARELIDLLALEGVEIRTHETPRGVTVQFVSTDPEVAARLQKELPKALKDLQEVAGRMPGPEERGRQWRERPGPETRLVPGVGTRPGWQGPPPQPAEPEEHEQGEEQQDD